MQMASSAIDIRTTVKGTCFCPALALDSRRKGGNVTPFSSLVVDVERMRLVDD